MDKKIIYIVLQSDRDDKNGLEEQTNCLGAFDNKEQAEDTFNRQVEKEQKIALSRFDEDDLTIEKSEGNDSWEIYLGYEYDTYHAHVWITPRELNVPIM